MYFYILKYTDDLPPQFAGYTVICMIKIRPEYKDDKGLLQHEYTHVCQNYEEPMYSAISYIAKYWLKIKWRWAEAYILNREVQAYRKQLEYRPHNAWTYAEFIASKYGLDVTVEEAYKLLTKEV